ncbi:MAG: electron transfer flavoprotein beta subunit [Bradymonadia bacterium]|jgi:electron transfer flavoprotein beta subunit
MKILTTMKRSIDPTLKVKLTADGQLDTTNVNYIPNYFDELGVEEALRLKEAGKATEVVVVSVGTQAAQKEIRTALAMGADRGILVEVDDEELDTLAVAKLLAAIVEKESPDLVLMGKLSVDSENNQVGQMLGELTGMPQGTFAHSIAVDDGWATVGREVDGGTADVRIKLPAIITADLRLNEPRYASLPGIMKAKRKPLEVIAADDLDVDADAQVRTLGYELPPERAAGVIVDSVDELIEKLKNEAKVI